MTLTLTTDVAPRRRSAPARLVQAHPLLTFFTLANLMSWTAWLPYILSENGLGLWSYRFPEVLGTSQLLGVLPGAYLGPITSAFIVTAVADGSVGLRRWVARLWRWRVRWTWYAVALLGVPAVLLLAGTVFSGGDVHVPPVLVLAAYLPGLLLQMLTTGLAEEPGWREFALPRLQSRFGPLRAALVLVVVPHHDHRPGGGARLDARAPALRRRRSRPSRCRSRCSAAETCSASPAALCSRRSSSP